MNKKLLFSGISIVTSLTLLAGSAFAAFTATASATGSTFSTGTDSLLVSPDNVTAHFQSTIASPFVGTHLTPGYHHVFTFYLKNDNTNSTDDLTVTAAFSNGSGDPALENALSTQFSCTDSNGTTTAPAFSVTSMLAGSVNLGKISSGETATCTMTVDLPSNVDNTVSGKTTSFNVNFNADGAPAPTPTP